MIKKINEITIKNCKINLAERHIFIHTPRGECLYISFGDTKIISRKEDNRLFGEGNYSWIGYELKELNNPKTELLD